STILSHDPGCRLADFQARAGGLLEHLGIPARDIAAVRDTLAELHQRMLRVPRLGVTEVLIEVRIAKLPAEPGVVPEQERKQHHGQGKERDQQVGSPAGTAAGPGSRWSSPYADRMLDGLHADSGRTRTFDADPNAARAVSTGSRLPAPSINPASVTRRGASEAVSSGRSVWASRFGTKL